jgi:hypothetical protein
MNCAARVIVNGKMLACDLPEGHSEWLHHAQVDGFDFYWKTDDAGVLQIRCMPIRAAHDLELAENLFSRVRL